MIGIKYIMKSELRKNYKLKRTQVEGRRFKDDKMCKFFLESSEYKESGTILGYYPLKNEIDILLILDRVLEDNKRLALPRCLDDRGNMEFCYVDDLSKLVDGPCGIKEPHKNMQKVERFDTAISIVPGIVYDRKGYRLGYGRGYYDRFLANNDIKSVGFCYEELLIDELPREEYDKKIDYIITDIGISRFDK